MRGDPTVRRPGKRGRLRALAVLALALGAGLAVWGAGRPGVAANRHQLSPPTRSLPDHDARLSFEARVPPQDIVRLVSEGRSEGETRTGSRVALAINEELQAQIFELFRRFDPPYGVFCAMEPDTGRVVALVGYRKGGESDPSLALKAIYPAASLFKVITAAAAIESGSVAPDAEIGYLGGIYTITKRNIHARDGGRTPTMSFEQAIALSANSVFGKVTVNYVGSERLETYMKKFGFGEPIPFVLPVESSKGEVPRDEFNLARTGAGFGEVYVSPLHMAMIMSAVGRGGEMPRPLLVESVWDNNGAVLYEDSPGKWRDTVSPETAETLARMMVKTIEMGTSRRTFGSPEKTPLLQDMEVAGKTGSLSGWTPRVHFEWFAGLAPVGSPRLAVAALVVNNGSWKIKGSYVGLEAFNTYFGYPSSLPPVYAKARGRGKARVRTAVKEKPLPKRKARRVRRRARKTAAAEEMKSVRPDRTSAVCPELRLPPPVPGGVPAVPA